MVEQYRKPLNRAKASGLRIGEKPAVDWIESTADRADEDAE